MTNQIAMYIHCAQCLEERPGDLSPSEFSALEVGLTDKHEVQIWCKRHDINVLIATPQELVEIPLVCGDPDCISHGPHH